MLPDNLKEMAVPAALDAWDGDALAGGVHEFGETTLYVQADRIIPVCRHLKADFGFLRLSAVTAIDRFPREPRFEVLYLLHSLKRNDRLKLKVFLPGEGAEVDSVTPVWEGAGWYEREVWDMFGVRFRNHPDPRRILMPEDWEGHPLRKDFPVHGHKYSYQDD